MFFARGNSFGVVGWLVVPYQRDVLATYHFHFEIHTNGHSGTRGGTVLRASATRVLELFTPLLFYTLFTLWKLYFLTAKFPAQFLPSLQFYPFIARKYPEILPNVISSGTLGVPDENLHIISTKRQFLFFIRPHATNKCVRVRLPRSKNLQSA